MTLHAALWFVRLLRAVAVAAARIAARALSPTPPREATRVLGSYRLERRIGRGGMGEVWRARHDRLARPAAIKLVRTDRRGPLARRDGLRVRFEREAQATATLASPHTVELYDYGISDEGELYYVMELLDGIDLETLVEEHGPLEPARVVAILRQVCHSLAEAHAKGLVHRDVKPSNVVLCRRGLDHDFVKVIDFGLVRRGPDGVDDAAISQELPAGGTPAFLAPEALTGAVDARADLYGLGCLAHWLLTGEPLFDADDVAAMLRAHRVEAVAPPSARSELPIPAELDALILRCLAKDPAARPGSARAIAAALDAIAGSDAWGPDDAERWWRLHLPPRASAAPRAPRPSLAPAWG